MISVGVTGGIASGKSLVMEVAAERGGVHVVFADRVAWDTYQPGKQAHRQILQTFGRKVLAEDGSIDRKELGSLVFADEDARRQLEAIVHPRVMERFREIRREAQQDSMDLVIEIPLLFGSEYIDQSFFDYVLLVRAPEKERIKRLMERDGVPRQEALRRISSQVNLDNYEDSVDYIIDSSGSEEETKESLIDIKKEIPPWVRIKRIMIWIQKTGK